MDAMRRKIPPISSSTLGLVPYPTLYFYPGPAAVPCAAGIVVVDLSNDLLPAFGGEIRNFEHAPVVMALRKAASTEV